MEPAGRRYSGYDEYEGIFGPLGVYGASSRHSHANTTSGFSGSSAVSGDGRKSSRRHANVRLASLRHAHSDLQSRAKYLDARRTKRKLKPFDINIDAEEDKSEREGANPLLAPPPHAQRQVWLPTRNFSFRQRAGKLDMRAIARLDLQKIVATTDIDTIQRHLENVAFADVTLEDVQHYSDAYFLKLFQIAQLTLEYLLNVQDSLLTHAEGVETQCEELLGECQQLERENSAFEVEVASLKKEIRHKQRTMATFEVMLLNASASNRRLPRAAGGGGIDKENAAAEANAIVDKLLGDDDAGEDEEGVVNKPVDCVVCGKKFLSAEYLIRHQQRKHQSDSAKNKKRLKTRKKKFSSSSPSPSSSDTESKSKGVKTASLPAEVVKALEEKNELARQLLTLQEQLRAEKDARDQQSKLLEGQQSQLTAHVVDNMGKLQAMLLEIERKQETTKHDMMQYTQETIQRLQTEAKNAQLLAKKSTSSRAGTILSDDEEREPLTSSKRPKDDWQETQLEKMLEVFFKAQTQQQQEIDALAQENSKLLSRTKTKHSKQRHRRAQVADSASSLMHMAALDAQRFGIDNGDLGREVVTSALPVQPIYKMVVQEDKLVQTDEEDDSRSRAKRVMTTHEVQTDTAVSEDTPPPPVKAPLPVQKQEQLRKSTVNATSLAQPKPAPVVKLKAVIATPDPPAVPPPIQPPVNKTDPSLDKEKRLQHAAQVVGKVALGFLTRRTLQNPANWLITLPFAALEGALSEQELGQLREVNLTTACELVIEVESGMTANKLRVAVARGLCGANEQSEGVDTDDKLMIDYHRVLLYHTVTREELHGDRPIHNFKNQIEVEIIPSYQEAEDHVEGVFEFHSDVTDRLREIRRASMKLPEIETGEAAQEIQVRRLVRLQARVRGFLAKRYVAILKIDQLIEKRLMKMRSVAAKRQVSSSAGLMMGDGISDSIVAAQCKRIHERLAAAVERKLNDTSLRPADDEDKVQKKTSTRRGISTAAYEQHLLELMQERSKLPSSVQSRIRNLNERLEQLVATEYDSERAKAHERRTDAAIKIQSAVQLAIARRRLQMLLAGSTDRPGAVATEELETPRHSSSSSSASSTPFSPLSALSSDDEPIGRRPRQEDKEDELEDFDAQEIAKLADAYEADEKLNSSIAIATAGNEKPSSPPLPAERNESPPVKDVELLEEKRHVVVRRSVTRASPLQAVPRSAGDNTTTLPPRAATPIRHVEAAAAEPGRSPRPKFENKEIISPFSKTPLLSRRSAPATRWGSGYDNAR